MSTKNSSTEPLVIERTFDAPVKTVWRALTDADDMRRWYFDLKHFKAEKGFEFEFTVEHEGNVFRHLCKVMAAVPHKKLAYTWRYADQPGDSLVTFELFAEGDKTRLKLTHTGLETFPALPAYARKNFEAGWTDLIGRSLPEYLQTADREIVMTRVFNAPRELVWEAMTNPKHVVNWWGPRGFSTTIEVMDVRVGGQWKHVMCGPDGAKYPNKSVFKEIVPHERIVFSHGGGHEQGPGANFTATWSFEAVTPKQTRVTARLVFSSPLEREFVVKEFGAIEGGKQTLERLGEFVAKELCRPFTISREFNAPRELVWKAWTQREQLMQWFGPKGFTMEFATMDFRAGGLFHYRMHGPNGVEFWGKFVFREIKPPERLVWVNSFSDKDAGITRHPLTTDPWPQQMLTEIALVESHGKTTVTVVFTPIDAIAEELQVFENRRDSMTQGWGGTLDKLTEHLAKGQA